MIEIVYDVLEKYTAVLMQPSKSIIRPEADLPYSKATLKEVLKACLARTSDGVIIK